MYAKTTLLGRVGADAEMRYTQSGTAVTSFSVAIDNSYKDKSGNKVDNTMWYRVTCWGKLAEVVSEYVVKGMTVLAEGEMTQPNVWQDKQGNQRANLELKAFTVKFVSGGRDSGQQSAPQQQQHADQNGSIPDTSDIPI